MDGWNTTFLLWRPIFRCKLLVSGRVPLKIQLTTVPWDRSLIKRRWSAVDVGGQDGTFATLQRGVEGMSDRYGCWTKNRGVKPLQIIHFNRVFHFYTPSILGVKSPIFGNTRMDRFLVWIWLHWIWVHPGPGKEQHHPRSPTSIAGGAISMQSQFGQIWGLHFVTYDFLWWLQVWTTLPHILGKSSAHLKPRLFSTGKVDVFFDLGCEESVAWVPFPRW